ncbi:hypothetical protein [Maribacter polysaccharolyticus]|uniref:hypothetical protein n=1 Tax=Maribacter polysaccharolyticus TaxID=3020831 RepID=UPI00237F2CAE|nr:hypothetical protein [Maribacter polysaccharolyticus]MDE3741738.1 hypothetical protein [Maribacter polysaccharolyticus]
MIYAQPFSKIRTGSLFVLLGILAVSCGSYQQASYYDNDGIYESDNVRVVERAPQQVEQEKSTDPYQDYFGQKADEYGEILDSEVFTDIDGYSSESAYDSIPQSEDLTDYYQPENDYVGYGGWGDNSTDVSINIYGNNWGYGGYYGWGFNDPWLWNNWGYGGYYGYYGWGGYYNPWAWNYWGWGGRFGYGWNYGFGYGYYGNRYYNRPFLRYGPRNYALNRSRRGYYNTYGVAGVNASRNLSARSNVNTRSASPRYRSSSTTARTSGVRSSSTARSTGTYRSSSTSRRAVGVDVNRAYRTSRSTRATPRYNSTSRSSSYYNRSSTPRSSTYKSSGSRTGTSRSYRSSGSSTRSSQSYRSTAPRTRSYKSSGNSSSRSSSYRSSSSSSSSRSSSARSSSRSSSSSGRRN